MRSFLSYLLLFSIALPTVSPWGTIAYFRLNREYIVRVLCEKRQRPEMQCNGKCYLAKILKKQKDEQDKETSERVRNLPDLQLFAQPFTSFNFFGKALFLKNNPSDFYKFSIYYSPQLHLLKPPRC